MAEACITPWTRRQHHEVLVLSQGTTHAYKTLLVRSLPVLFIYFFQFTLKNTRVNIADVSEARGVGHPL
jgi:hypothetical protein